MCPKINSPKEVLIKINETLDKITDINAQLLKNSLSPQNDLLVLEAQEIALECLCNLQDYDLQK
ncbi:MAG: hypothetical protein WC365_09100 [Candidatus Babeliales bacterium]|jgi:hypothetical protein